MKKFVTPSFFLLLSLLPSIVFAGGNPLQAGERGSGGISSRIITKTQIGKEPAEIRIVLDNDTDGVMKDVELTVMDCKARCTTKPLEIVDVSGDFSLDDLEALDGNTYRVGKLFDIPADKVIDFTLHVQVVDGESSGYYSAYYSHTSTGQYLKGESSFTVYENGKFVGSVGSSNQDEKTDPFYIASPFNDIDGHWAQAFIEDIRLRGIIDGKSEGVFDPEGLITRAELTKIAMETFKGNFDRRYPLEELYPEIFPDVDRYEWYSAYISEAKKNGIVQGYSDGFFKPHNYVSRAEALKIILKAAEIDLSGTTDGETSEWWMPYISYAEKNELLYNNTVTSPHQEPQEVPYEPHLFATRAEVAKFASLITRLKENSLLESSASIKMLSEEDSAMINSHYGFDTQNMWKKYVNHSYGFSFYFPAVATRILDNDYFRTEVAEKNGTLIINIDDGQQNINNGIKIYFQKVNNKEELEAFVSDIFGECEVYNLDENQNEPIDYFGFGGKENMAEPFSCAIGKPRGVYNYSTGTAIIYSISNGKTFHILDHWTEPDDLYPYGLFFGDSSVSTQLDFQQNK